MSMDQRTASEVTEANAMRLNDNYRVEDEDGIHFHMEHNPTEAKALARWLSVEHGHTYHVVRIPIDVVKAAKAIRPEPLRFEWRYEALKDMGVI